MRTAPSAVLLAGLVLVAGPAAASAADLTVDDRTLAHAGKWSKVASAKAKGRTLLKAARKGATLTAKTKATKGGSVVLQVGKGRGTVALSVNGKRQKTIATSARKTALKAYRFKGAGTVRLTVTRLGKGVYVDAIVLTGLGRPTTAGSSPAPGGPPAAGTPAGPGPGAGAVPPSAVNRGPLAQVDASAAGAGGNGNGLRGAAIAPDGKRVAFWSNATNLVPGVVDGRDHLYVKTLADGAIRVVDAAQDGTLSNDTSTAEATRAIAWKPDSTEILFSSRATNLGPNVSGGTGPFLYAKQLDNNSVGVIAQQVSSDAAWSPDGAKIAFGTAYDYCQTAFTLGPCGTTATSDVKLFVYDIAADRYRVASATAAGAQPQVDGSSQSIAHPVWSPDSGRLAFEYSGTQLDAGDTNVYTDIYVKDMGTLAIRRISVNAAGGQTDGTSEWPAWSPDGTRIAFDSKADNLVAGDDNSGEDVFVKDLAGGAVTAISAAPGPAFRRFSHRVPKWSPDGTKIAFNSKSVDLIGGYVDANQAEDVYVRDLATGAFQVVSARADGVIGGAGSTLWDVFGSTGGWTPDGRGLVFFSQAGNFGAADANGTSESLFLKTGL